MKTRIIQPFLICMVLSAAVLAVSPAQALWEPPNGGNGEGPGYDPENYEQIGNFSFNQEALGFKGGKSSPTPTGEYSGASSMAGFVEVKKHTGTTFSNTSNAAVLEADVTQLFGMPLPKTTGDNDDVKSVLTTGINEFGASGAPQLPHNSLVSGVSSLDDEEYSDIGEEGPEIIDDFNF